MSQTYTQLRSKFVGVLASQLNAIQEKPVIVHSVAGFFFCALGQALTCQRVLQKA